jgi:hypothetical protein
VLIQCHWQNRIKPSETRFIAQGEVDGDCLVAGVEATQWAGKVFEQHREEMPEGWCAMVCTEDAKEFVKTPPDARSQDIEGAALQASLADQGNATADDVSLNRD